MPCGKQWACTSRFIGGTTEELDRAVKAPDQAEDDVDELFESDDSTVPGGPSAELDKMWDGLQFLLGEAGVGFEFMMDGFLIAEEGTLFRWSAEHVEAVARQLRATPWERLAAHFDPERMIKENVYPHVWDVAPESELEWLESAYGDLVEFFGAAADRGLGAFMTFSFWRVGEPPC